MRIFLSVKEKALELKKTQELKYSKVFLNMSVVLGVNSQYNLLLNCNIIFNIKVVITHYYGPKVKHNPNTLAIVI